MTTENLNLNGFKELYDQCPQELKDSFAQLFGIDAAIPPDTVEITTDKVKENIKKITNIYKLGDLSNFLRTKENETNQKVTQQICTIIIEAIHQRLVERDLKTLLGIYQDSPIPNPISFEHADPEKNIKKIEGFSRLHDLYEYLDGIAEARQIIDNEIMKRIITSKIDIKNIEETRLNAMYMRWCETKTDDSNSTVTSACQKIYDEKKRRKLVEISQRKKEYTHGEFDPKLLKEYTLEALNSYFTEFCSTEGFYKLYEENRIVSAKEIAKKNIDNISLIINEIIDIQTAESEEALKKWSTKIALAFSSSAMFTLAIWEIARKFGILPGILMLALCIPIFVVKFLIDLWKINENFKSLASQISNLKAFCKNILTKIKNTKDDQANQQALEESNSLLKTFFGSLADRLNYFAGIITYSCKPVLTGKKGDRITLAIAGVVGAAIGYGGKGYMKVTGIADNFRKISEKLQNNFGTQVSTDAEKAGLTSVVRSPLVYIISTLTILCLAAYGVIGSYAIFHCAKLGALTLFGANPIVMGIAAAVLIGLFIWDVGVQIKDIWQREKNNNSQTGDGSIFNMLSAAFLTLISFMTLKILKSTFAFVFGIVSAVLMVITDCILAPWNRKPAGRANSPIPAESTAGDGKDPKVAFDANEDHGKPKDEPLPSYKDVANDQANAGKDVEQPATGDNPPDPPPSADDPTTYAVVPRSPASPAASLAQNQYSIWNSREADVSQLRDSEIAICQPHQ
jgi:hypothetical protein